MIFRYSLLWFALAVVAVFNGMLREQTYGKFISELSAHQLSTVTGMLLSGLLVYLVHKWWPIKSSAQAWTIGVIWLTATVAFEFLFGHYLAGHSWSHLLNDYNLLQGRVWLLFLLWVLILPVVIHRASTTRESDMRCH